MLTGCIVLLNMSCCDDVAYAPYSFNLEMTGHMIKAIPARGTATIEYEHWRFFDVDYVIYIYRE